MDSTIRWNGAGELKSMPPNQNTLAHNQTQFLEVSLLLRRTAGKSSKPRGVIMLLIVLALFTGTHDEQSIANVATTSPHSEDRRRCIASLSSNQAEILKVC